MPGRIASWLALGASLGVHNAPLATIRLTLVDENGKIPSDKIARTERVCHPHCGHVRRRTRLEIEINRDCR